jgi:hypothetical protein
LVFWFTLRLFKKEGKKVNFEPKLF